MTPFHVLSDATYELIIKYSTSFLLGFPYS